MEERLQKIISRAGIASRRAAEKMIKEGRVRVNDAVVRQLGSKADAEKDAIRVDGNLFLPEVSNIYLMLNKPAGYVTTLHDPQGRPIITDLLSDVTERVFPVGRLDYNSEGLLLLTNNGDFAQRLLHPRFKIPKIYRVKIKGNLNSSEVRAIESGLDLKDGKFRPVSFNIEKKNIKNCWVNVTITEGRSRIIRKSFDSLGHPVLRLIRIGIANLYLDDLKAGTYRSLTKRDIQRVLSK
ncbi:MAG: pseudouridine synthase [Syntrophales bacterium]